MADWNTLQTKGNVTDRRGARSVGKISIASVALLMGVTYLMGGNPLEVLLQASPELLTQSVQTESQEDTSKFAGVDAYEGFVSTVLGSTDEYWKAQFNKRKQTYSVPELVLFRGRTTSACGGAASVVGPHYCPADETIYLDETFFAQLQTTLGATGGDVAEAYVIAHEVGHHVQNELGLLADRTTNTGSIKTELQADCLAGLWLGSLENKQVFSEGELFEAIDAAQSVGDDNIQKRTKGEVQPESWTHGSSAERKAALQTGLQAKTITTCI